MWQNERAFVDHMNFLKSIGATVINTSDQSFSIQHQWNTPLSNKKVLNDDEWEVLTKGLDHLGKIAYDSGMKIVYHHHMTTTRAEDPTKSTVCYAMTDPKYVSMIYDTGHLTFSGEDPIEILKKHYDRIGHVHLKKCPQACNGQVLRREQELPPFDSGRRIHRSRRPGRLRRLPDRIQAARRVQLRGWLVVEAEQDPAIANPLEYARMARAYVKEHTGL